MAIRFPRSIFTHVLLSSAFAFCELAFAETVSKNLHIEEVELDSISVSASSEGANHDESSFTIDVIDTSAYLNSSKDINQVLKNAIT